MSEYIEGKYDCCHPCKHAKKQIKNLEQIASDADTYRPLYEQSQAEITGLQVVLNKVYSLASNSHYHNADANEKCYPECFERSIEALCIQALSSSKLGELFLALLEEHKIMSDYEIFTEQEEVWQKVEALRKEVGL